MLKQTENMQFYNVSVALVFIALTKIARYSTFHKYDSK